MPTVSVVIPAYKAGKTLGRAVASVASAGLPLNALEVVIAPDDGQPVAQFDAQGVPLVTLPPGPVRSGPGPARNRAIAAARGDFVAFLDADDTWEAGYLAALLPLAQTSGVAFGRTRIVNDDRTLLDLPRQGAASLSFTDMAASGASFHPVLRRELAGPFRNRPAQDILHSVEVLACVGGSAPLASIAYELRLGSATETRSDAFLAWIDAAYAQTQSDILSGRTRVPQALRVEAAQVYAAKTALNDAFAESGETSFYDFVARRL